MRSHHFLPLSSIHLDNDALSLTSDELQILRDPALIPKWYPSPSAPVLQRRLRYVGDILGAIMASYPKPQQALFGLCSALSTSNYAYDFQSILQVLQRDALDLTRTQFTIVDGYLKANDSSSFLLDFVPPTFPFIHSIQSDLYHAPRNLVFRSPAAQQVVSYLRHETYFSFFHRHNIDSTSITTPLNGAIFPSATMLQLHLQHRFLNTSYRARTR